MFAQLETLGWQFSSFDIKFWTNSNLLVQCAFPAIAASQRSTRNEWLFSLTMITMTIRLWPKPGQARPSPARFPLLLPALLPTPAKIGQQFSLLVPFRCTFTLPLCLYPEFQSWDENFEIVSYCKNFHTRMYEIPFDMHCCNFGGFHLHLFSFNFPFNNIAN